ncbi:MAG: aminotransferase class V-fold PLP-dependent enzyme [Gemmatimonadetes bacterium]|nr:aminotransferase class V-fold PLP-dependent enzyme [Gemmatimonadota bacterium]
MRSRSWPPFQLVVLRLVSQLRVELRCEPPAERAGARVVFAEPDPETLELPAAAVEAVLSERTRWVAVTAASNAVGTIPDLEGIVAAARAR